MAGFPSNIFSDSLLIVNLTLASQSSYLLVHMCFKCNSSEIYFVGCVSRCEGLRYSFAAAVWTDWCSVGEHEAHSLSSLHMSVKYRQNCCSYTVRYMCVQGKQSSRYKGADV